MALIKQNEYVNILLKAGGNVNLPGNVGPPILFAAGLGQNDMLRALLSSGADVNMTKVDHYTPLMAACENGHKSCEGANVNACAVNGNSAAILTAANGSAECLDLLIQAGADVNQMTNQQMTALQCAVMAGNKQCVKLLAQTDADINTVGPRGWTPLMQAIVKNHPECASVLLQKGADVNYVNHQGVSVLSVAAASTVCSVQLLLSNRVHVRSQTGTYGESTLESYIYDFPKLNQNIILLLLAAGEAMGPDMLQGSSRTTREFNEICAKPAGRKEGLLKITVQKSSKKCTASTESSESVLQGSQT